MPTLHIYMYIVQHAQQAVSCQQPRDKERERESARERERESERDRASKSLNSFERVLLDYRLQIELYKETL